MTHQIPSHLAFCTPGKNKKKNKARDKSRDIKEKVGNMASKTICTTIQVTLIVAFLTTQVVFSDDTVPIPAHKAQLGTWFSTNVGPLDQRKSTMDPALVAAEEGAKVVKVMQDGNGELKTITDAIDWKQQACDCVHWSWKL